MLLILGPGIDPDLTTRQHIDQHFRQMELLNEGMAGLIHTWILAPSAFELVSVSKSAIQAYLVGLGFARS